MSSDHHGLHDDDDGDGDEDGDDDGEEDRDLEMVERVLSNLRDLQNSQKSLNPLDRSLSTISQVMMTMTMIIIIMMMMMTMMLSL